ncbi:initiator RepB protein, partial [gut metagenome]
EKRVVVFEKGELEGLLGVSRINLPQLKERLKHLMGNVVEVGNPKQPKSMHLITLFDEAVAVQDETTGLWEVRLECTQKAMKYCFNIDKIGYLRYKLRGIVALQSRYSYVLFLYLESNRRYKTWTVPLDELKAVLKCDTEETYKEFKFFNQKILQRCSKEIFEKTDQRFTYEPIKKGRKVVAIKFTLETISDI